MGVGDRLGVTVEQVGVHIVGPLEHMADMRHDIEMRERAEAIRTRCLVGIEIADRALAKSRNSIQRCLVCSFGAYDGSRCGACDYGLVAHRGRPQGLPEGVVHGMTTGRFIATPEGIGEVELFAGGRVLQ